MDKIRIQGLRSLVDTGLLQLKPITLLLGRNSSGKSSLLRMLPVLRQSLEPGNKNPLVLNGRYIDMDNLKQVCSSYTEIESTKLTINVSTSSEQGNTRFFFPHVPDFGKDYLIESEFYPLGERDNYVRSIRVISEHTSLDISFLQDGAIETCVYNNLELSSILSQVKVRQNSYIPSFPYDEHFAFIPNTNSLMKIIIDLIKKHTHGRLSDGKILRQIYFCRFNEKERVLKHFLKSDFGKTWEKNTSQWTTESQDFFDLYKAVIASRIPAILSYINECLRQETAAVKYIAPIRASAQRYYRFNDSSVSEIDPLGSNVSMYLYSMSETERKSFREWTNTHFGFEFHARSKFGHLSITVNDGHEEVNLADTGFGYSQLLPILIHLWETQRKNKKNRQNNTITNIYAVEQPELHLHPHMIGKLTESICGIIEANKRLEQNNLFILETHSTTVVDTLGANIAQGKTDPNDVTIILFEKESPSTATTVTETSYTEDGFLRDWPAGFLSADM
ncbi:MAG: AAA family ATPase [Desulfovibrio sp.]